jgi:DNA-binding transcriptional LysR family regulator
LLVVFNQLLFDRRVWKVADTLGGSQPAVRSSLAKLRKLLGNDLCVRTPKGREPTPYAD